MLGKSLGRHLAVTAMAMVIAFSLGLSADADKNKKEKEKDPAGFLGDFAELEPEPADGTVVVYRKEAGVLGSYGQLILDPVLIYLHPQARDAGINPEELQRMAAFLRARTKEALEEAGYEVVEEPGPGTARVRAAITGVDLAAGLPIPTVDVGRASIEAAIFDSLSGERLVAVVDAEKGKRFPHLESSAPPWGDVEGAFEKWTGELRKKLREARRTVG